MHQMQPIVPWPPPQSRQPLIKAEEVDRSLSSSAKIAKSVCLPSHCLAFVRTRDRSRHPGTKNTAKNTGNHARHQPPFDAACCSGPIPRQRIESGPHRRISSARALRRSTTTTAAQQCVSFSAAAAKHSRPNSTAPLPDSSEAPVQEPPRPGPRLQPAGDGEETGGDTRSQIPCGVRTGGRPAQWLVVAPRGGLPAAPVPLPRSQNGRQGRWRGRIPPGIFRLSRSRNEVHHDHSQGDGRPGCLPIGAPGRPPPRPEGRRHPHPSGRYHRNQWEQSPRSQGMAGRVGFLDCLVLSLE